MLSGVAVETRKSWIMISTYIETVQFPSRKQNVLIPPQNGRVLHIGRSNATLAAAAALANSRSRVTNGSPRSIASSN